MLIVSAVLICLLLSRCAFAGEGFEERFSDSSAAEKWRQANVSDAPPAAFDLNGRSSRSLRWLTEEGKWEKHRDYALSDKPADRLTRTRSWVCPEEQLMLTVTESLYPGFPVAEYDSRLVNLSEKPSGLISGIAPLDADVMKGSAAAHYNRGTTIPCSAIEYAPLSSEIRGDGELEVRTVTGLPTQDYLPFFNFSGKKGGVIAAVNWQGNWFMKARISGGRLHLTAGQGETRLCLLPREELRLPGIVLMFYKGADWQEGQNLWRRWIVRHNLFRHTQKRFEELVYVASPLNQDLAADLAAIDSPFVRRIAEEYYTVMEYDYSGVRGWFDCTRMNPGETGDWNPAPDYEGEKGLKQISEHCRRQGIGLCFWIEPERCYEGTDMERSLREEDLMRDGRLAVVNMGSKNAEDHLFRLASGLIDDFGLTLYRQDFNTNNEPFWTNRDLEEEARLGIPRRGTTESRACEGYIRYWSRLAEKYPGMLFDSCASGGRRNDLETMRFSFMHTKTDFWGFTVPQQCQNFGCNMWYIFTGSVLYNHFSDYEIRSRLSLSVGVDINPVGEDTLKVLDEWRYDHKYLMKDYYTLTDYDLSGENNMAVQMNDPEKGCGMLIAYLRRGGGFRFVCKGLEPDRRYLLTDRDDGEYRRVMTGRDMMTDGVTVKRPREASAPCLEYSLTDLPVTEYEAGEEALSPVDSLPFFGKNDMDALCAEYKKNVPGPNSLVYAGPDYDTSGGIYSLSRDLYDKLPFTGIVANDGWIKLDPSRLYLEMDVVRALTIWPEGGFFDVSAYAKKADGCCFLWLDNTFTFGDLDGGAKTEPRRLGVAANGGIEWSEPFVLRVSEWDRPGERAVYFVGYDEDKTGTVYRCAKHVWDALPCAGDPVERMGTGWLPLDTENTYLSGEGLRDVTLFKGEKNGRYYIWAANSRSLEVSATAYLYYTDKDVKRRTVFCMVGKRFRSTEALLPQVEEF
ncbi:MAG: alpha-galactosidase [Abditibacteriota bacterium]|nr:alpha-galactosidase [Abditibacteriota bacterium]